MEVNTTRDCTYCGKEKPWIWNKKKLKDGSKIYVDANGSRWAGKRCPDCERTRVSAAVRCDSFERDMITSQLEADGYKILVKTLPMIAEKDGEKFTVGIKRAIADEGKIVIESPMDKKADLHVFVFESARICSKEQLARLGPSLEVRS